MLLIFGESHKTREGEEH